MQFHKFHSIENSYREKFLNTIRSHPSSEEEWCVLEKVHGSNFSFTVSDDDIKVGKRTSFLETKEDFNQFFNCGQIVDDLYPKVKDLLNKYKEKYGDVKFLTVYGELFGGFYEGKKITHKMIQKGVQYCPHHEFMAFDIRVTGENDQGKYINYDRAISLFEEAGLFYADKLYQGSLDDCLKWSSEHNADQTTIPPLLGIEEDIKDNVREGHVLKPLNPGYLEDGTAIVLKDKNTLFKEKQSKKETVCEKYKQLIDEISKYITENRFQNVVSKEGPVTKRSIGKYVSLLVQDALEEYIKENGELPVEEKKIRKNLNKISSQIVLKEL